jgi:hypothetical protein
MIPREKAAQLIVDYQLNVKSLDYKEAIQCSLRTVDELLKELENIDDGQTVIPYDYWQQVKQEIEKYDTTGSNTSIY